MHDHIDDLARQYISIAEKQFGKACSEWKFVGVEFNSQPPHLRYYHDTGEMAISLSNNAKASELELRCQLAHEVCHALYPTVAIDKCEPVAATVLNEGVSTSFQLSVIPNEDDIKKAIDILKEHSPNYFEALGLVLELMSIVPDAIKKLRSVQPKLNDITELDFVKSGVSASPDLISSLLRKFE
jgi:hypothetical protein